MHTRIQTPQMSKVRDLADSALNTPDGLEVFFRASRYGSLKGAHAAAKGLQSAFSALRARTRRGAMRQNSEAEYSRDVRSIGPYDSLACVLSWLPDDEGCKIALMPGSAYGMDFEVIDRSTGEPFAPEDPRMNRFVFLGQKRIHEDMEAKRQRRPYVEPLTEAELQFCWAFDPEGCVEFNFPKPQSMLPNRTPEENGKIDLADLDWSPEDMDAQTEESQ